MPPEQMELDAAVAKVEPMLKADYADWYTGFALQQPGPGESVKSALLIYRIPHPALDAAVRAVLPGLLLIFEDSPYNAVEIKRFQDRIVASASSGKEKGFMITAVGCDFQGVCTIGVDDPGKATGPLDAEFGATRIKVVKEAPATAL